MCGLDSQENKIKHFCDLWLQSVVEHPALVLYLRITGWAASAPAATLFFVWVAMSDLLALREGLAIVLLD